MIDPFSAPAGLARRGVLAGGLATIASPALARDDLDGFVASEMAKAGIPGLALASAQRGVVRLARGYGFADLARRRPATAQTMFHIASITKTITATAVVQLVERGLVGLDEPVAPRLGFPLANPHHPQAPITLRHLLTHTSGISDARYYEIDFRERGRDSAQPLEAFLREYLVPGGRTFSAEGSFAAAAPGEAWDYSNVGYALLGYLAGRIGGQDMRLQSRERIFAPLGMHHTSWSLAGVPEALRATPYDLIDGKPAPVEPVGFPDWPAGMIRSSAADLIRFVGASANRGGRVLSPSRQAQMLEMTRPAGLPGWLTGQGLGWQASKLAGGARPNHWGGDPGVFTVAYLDPETRSAAVVLTNLTVSAAGKDAVQAIAARLLAG